MCSIRTEEIPVTFRPHTLHALAAALVALVLVHPTFAQPEPPSRPHTAPRVAPRGPAGALDLGAIRFERNDGQFAAGARFGALLGASTVQFALDCITLAPDSGALGAMKLRFPGAQSGVRIRGEAPLSATASYFVGPDPRSWVRNAPTFARLTYEGLFRGVDAIFYGDSDGLEYDFVIAPHADPRAIRLAF